MDTENADVKELFEIVESGNLQEVKEFISKRGVSASVTNKVLLNSLWQYISGHWGRGEGGGGGGGVPRVFPYSDMRTILRAHAPPPPPPPPRSTQSSARFKS